MLRSLSLACTVAVAHAASLTPQQGVGMRVRSAIKQDGLASARAAQSAIAMGQQIVVTDGTDSFYESRTVFSSLHEFGDYDKIIACSTSSAEANKMLLSRNARYSGLLDKLEIVDSPLADAMAGCDVWLSVNADVSAAKTQITAAKKAGVKRVLLLFTADGPEAKPSDISALKSSLESSGLVFSVVRTGKLVSKGTGGGLLCGEVADECADVPKEDIFRFVTEALTLEAAETRLVSLLPTADDTQFREMRRAGCDRREEAEALLKGVIKEKSADEVAAEEEAAAAKKKSETKTDKPEKETTPEELQMLLERARKAGEENKKRMEEEEAEKLRKREERVAYFKAADDAAEEKKSYPKDDDDDSDTDKDEPEAPKGDAGDGAPNDSGNGGGDSGGSKDKPDAPPLALA